jgi:hypothetical protein
MATAITLSASLRFKPKAVFLCLKKNKKKKKKVETKHNTSQVVTLGPLSPFPFPSIFLSTFPFLLALLPLLHFSLPIRDIWGGDGKGWAKDQTLELGLLRVLGRVYLTLPWEGKKIFPLIPSFPPTLCVFPKRTRLAGRGPVGQFFLLDNVAINRCCQEQRMGCQLRENDL